MFMKKGNNLGFMLTETLIVSTFITVTLLYMFVQFQQINRNYNRTFTYNTVNSLYSAEQIRTYILDFDFDNIKSVLNNENQKYLSLTECPDDLFAEINYCEELFTALNVKNVYFTHDDIGGLKEELRSDLYVDEQTITFLDYIDYTQGSAAYRLIVHFDDDTHATLKVNEEV